ncbi:MAG: hypothetical protein P4L77_11770 [Sulfuriferula sp.]|nr:hypothetical protein [Sulfuriferula sp.]
MGLVLEPGEDLHCSMDKKSTTEWLLAHTRENDRPYELWIQEFDRLLSERRQREEFHVTGGMQFDTKRLIVGFEGKNRVARKIEYVTHRVFDWMSDDDDQQSHEWHTYYLVFDEEDFILGMVTCHPNITPMAWTDAMKIQENYKKLAAPQTELICKK